MEPGDTLDFSCELCGEMLQIVIFNGLTYNCGICHQKYLWAEDELLAYRGDALEPIHT